MRFFLDTANIEEIRQGLELGLVDGVTTNPSLLSRQKGDWREIARSLCTLVPGPVSLEVLATDAEGMINQARELISFAPNVVVKIPMTAEGLMAVRALKILQIPTNMTLVFSATQALAAAKAGADYVSPFVGRLDDYGQSGMDLVRDILDIYANYALPTEVIVASVRSTTHVREAALAGAHIATVPYSILCRMLNHPLTDSGLEQFLQDWKTRQ